VDPALVIHHFGDKQALFVAAHELPADPARLVEQITHVPVPERGEAIARAYLGVLAAPGSAALSLLRAAATNPEAARMLREFLQATAFSRGVELLVDPDADGELRLALIASQLLGIAVARELVGIPQLVDRERDEIVHAVAPTIQRLLAPS
jgi:AcrR family transcriptional regulator